jgi:hypothetical protein
MKRQESSSLSDIRCSMFDFRETMDDKRETILIYKVE